jgi:GTP cyclohydrolase I
MHSELGALRALPDIAHEAEAAVAGPLDWVGMDRIDVPVRLSGDGGQAASTAARVAAYVNLNQPDVRGIHMSRLYLHVDKALSAEPLTPCSIRRLLRDFLDSHAQLSDRAMVRIEFDHLVRRAALKSDNSGWKSYPVRIVGTMDKGHFTLELGCDVVYSSTCPCSAALARQLIQQRFTQDFAHGRHLDYDAVVAWLGSEQGICATPHSQRSVASVQVKLAPAFDFPIVELIDRRSGWSPVQTAVKREDEQAFALLNGRTSCLRRRCAAFRPHSTPTIACMTTRFVRRTGSLHRDAVGCDQRGCSGYGPLPADVHRNRSSARRVGRGGLG